MDWVGTMTTYINTKNYIAQPMYNPLELSMENHVLQILPVTQQSHPLPTLRQMPSEWVGVWISPQSWKQSAMI